MSTSSVPSLSFTVTGVQVPVTSAIFGGVLADWNYSFGGNLNIANVATPQGYICTEISNYLVNQNAAIAYLASQTDPETAEGRFQDAIGRLNFIMRNPAVSTVVSCIVTGSPGQILSAGAQATDGTYTYSSLSDVSFSGGGTATVQFANNTPGAFGCLAGTLNRIAIGVTGWDAVNNPSDGIIGSPIQSTYDFEAMREASLAKNGQNTNYSILGIVLAVPGVIDCYVTENTTGSPVATGATNYSLLANSIYIAVYGGAEADIAAAIWSKMAPGCNMNGNTTATVYDSTYDYPYPAYSVIYNIPTALPIYFAVVVANHPGLPSDYIIQIQNAIISAFNGQDGQGRAKIGNDIYASRFYANVAAITGVRIKTLLIGTSITPTGNEVLVGIDQMPTITAANIAVSAI